MVMPLFSLLFLFACGSGVDVDIDVDNTAYEAEFAIPVIKDASVSFTELWQNDAPGQSLIVGPAGELIFRYESDPVEVTTLDIIGELEFPVISGLPDTVSKLPFVLPSNIIIEEAAISGGILLFQFRPIGDAAAAITFSLPHIKLDGVPLEITANGFSGSTVPVDLTGYTFEPEGNELEIRYSAKDAAGNTIVLEGAGVIARPRLTFVKGTWGREEFPLPQATVEIDLYDERFLNGHIRFAQPTITAKIESSFGLPIRSRVDVLTAFTKTGEEMSIDASAIDGVDINYPLLSERGIRKETVLQLDYTNSNIVEVFDTEPTEVEYGLTAIANPEDDQDLKVFIEDTSTFKAQLVVEVPVVGSTQSFTAKETFEVPFEDIDQIAEGEFKLIVENELPIGAQLQFYFIKGNKEIIDSLFQDIPQLVEAAAVDGSGNVTVAAETTTFIPVEADKMKNIIEADRVQVNAIFQTAGGGQQDVVIKADQMINFRMGLKFKI